MDFGTIFWPLFTALITAYLVTQGIDFVIGYLFHKKQLRNRKEFEARMERGEVSQAEMFAVTGGMMPGMQMAPGSASSEDEKSEETPEGVNIGHGQYL